MRTHITLFALSLLYCAEAQPVHYWPLDETQGTLAHDFAGNGNGVVHGSCTWQPAGGHHGGAMRFYGNDARVDLGPCDIVTGSGDRFSVACWFKPLIVAGTERVLIAKTIGSGASDWIWSLSLVNSTGARFRIHGATGVVVADVPASSIFSNAWYHLAAVYDGSAMRVYLNGSLAVTQPANGGLGFHPEAPATMGQLVNGALPFYGELDDVRLYDHDLSEAEVIDLVIGQVNTGIADPGDVRIADGGFTVPPGTWNEATICDASGRVLSTIALRGMSGRVPLPTLPAGVHVLTLQGTERRQARVFVSP